MATACSHGSVVLVSTGTKQSKQPDRVAVDAFIASHGLGLTKPPIGIALDKLRAEILPTVILMRARLASKVEWRWNRRSSGLDIPEGLSPLYFLPASLARNSGGATALLSVR